jgi:hypothetical protein
MIPTWPMANNLYYYLHNKFTDTSIFLHTVFIFLKQVIIKNLEVDMKKTLILLAGILLIVSSYAYGFNAEFESDALKIRTVSESSTLAVGENPVYIEIRDSAGRYIKDMEVDVYYFMPSMPAMNDEAKSSLNGSRYAAVIKPVMPGEWTADITLKKTGEVIKKVSVNFNVK